MTITEFLTARWAEEEKRATIYRDIVARLTIVFGPIDPDAGELHVAQAAHLALARTADRIDADIAAKRAILQAWAARADDDHPAISAHRTGLGLAIKFLAQPFADHPDFDESWKP